MKKTWNALFGYDKYVDEYSADRRDHLIEAYFLSRTGVTLGAVQGFRRSEPKTGEFDLGD